jgi:hypothetical protein
MMQQLISDIKTHLLDSVAKLDINQKKETSESFNISNKQVVCNRLF